MLDLAQRKTIRQNAVTALKNSKIAYIAGYDARDYIQQLMSLGDVDLSNCTLDSVGYLKPKKSAPKVRSVKPVKPVKRAGTAAVTKAAPVVGSRKVTSKGINIPQEVLTQLGIVATYGAVYIRPLNVYSFLVMNKRGTNPSTRGVFRQKGGKIVVTTSMLNTLGFAGRVGQNIRIAPNGKTGDTYIVSLA